MAFHLDCGLQMGHRLSTSLLDDVSSSLLYLSDTILLADFEVCALAATSRTLRRAVEKATRSICARRGRKKIDSRHTWRQVLFHADSTRRRLRSVTCQGGGIYAGNPANPQVKAKITCFVALSEGRFVTAGDFSSFPGLWKEQRYPLQVWDSHTGQCMSVLHGHTQGTMHMLHLGGDQLVTGSHDATLRVWRCEKGRHGCERVL